MDDDDPRGHGVSTALGALLAGLVDYAGLFPPAALSMRDAVRKYGRYRVSAQHGMLARFVVPAARLEEFAALAPLARHAGDVGPWPLAVLAAAGDASALDAFDAAYGTFARVDTIEAKADDAATIAALAAAFAMRAVYVELPVRSDPAALIAACKAQGLRAKIRTGGVTPEAFPSPNEVLRFLAACVAQGVPFKATAGLHHPLRGEYPLTYAPDAARGTMYGFLNVFLAALLLLEGHPAAEVAPVLEERDASSIQVSADGIAWRGRAVPVARIAEARAAFAGSFGSCSFEEPVQDLVSLSLLPRT